jgi:hypothetical protein
MRIGANELWQAIYKTRVNRKVVKKDATLIPPCSVTSVRSVNG